MARKTSVAKKATKKAAPKRKGARKTSAPAGQRTQRQGRRRISPIGFMQSRNGGWLVRALDEQIDPGDIIDVPRKDGSVSTVKILSIVWEGEFEDGTQCIMAKFRGVQQRHKNNHYEDDDEEIPF